MVASAIVPPRATSPLVNCLVTPLCGGYIRDRWSVAGFAGVIQLVECQLPKLDVAGSSPVARSSRHQRKLAEPSGLGVLVPGRAALLASRLLKRRDMRTDDRAGGSQTEPGDREQTPEDREREAARRREESRERERAAGTAPSRPDPARELRGGVSLRVFEALADNVRDYAIFLMDRDGVITYWGQGARLIKWWSKEAAEGAHLRLLYPSGGSQDGTAEAHLRAAAERGEYTGEGQRVRSDGSTFWAGVTLTALWDDEGTLLGFAKVTRDLTARRAADALLQTAAEAAESARRNAVAASMAKSGFLATMSHELRTPINAVMGYHDLLDLEVEGPLTPGQRRFLARANSSARHLLSLVAEVLDFSRIEADRMPVLRKAFRVGDAVSGALGLVAPQARAHHLEIADAVAGYAQGLAAWGDEPRVRQILVNLLSNAVKFTRPRDGEAGRIIVSAGTATQPSPEARLAGEGPWVYIRVEDTGAGIPADQLEAIFEPFIQADMTLTRTQGGTGLGLAISRRLARLMGGDVTVRSEPGMGSTFLLWLAAAPVESLATGGLEGHGPGGEAESVSEEEVSQLRREQDTGRASTPLRAIADAILGETERVLHGYVARLRTDPETSAARAAGEAQIEDHLASFLADIASTLRTIDGPGEGPAGGPNSSLADATAIQRIVAERHGAQRARLGWTEQEVRREFTILREELSAAVLRRAGVEIPGPNAEARLGEAERALELLGQFLAIAERLSVNSLRSVKEALATTTSEAPAPGAE
jgi:PAS domain S-box-containing protein